MPIAKPCCIVMMNNHWVISKMDNEEYENTPSESEMAQWEKERKQWEKALKKSEEQLRPNYTTT